MTQGKHVYEVRPRKESGLSIRRSAGADYNPAQMDWRNIRTWFCNPLTWGGLAIACFVGVWWYKMTPGTSNLTVIAGIVFSTIMVWFAPLVSSRTPIVRFLCAVVAGCLVAMLQYHLGFWSEDKPMTLSNADKLLEEWIGDFPKNWEQCSVRKVNVPGTSIGYDVIFPDNLGIGISRSKDEWSKVVTFAAVFNLTDADLSTFQGLPASKQNDITRELTIETGRANMHCDQLNLSRPVTISKDIPISEGLTREVFYEAILTFHSNLRLLNSATNKLLADATTKPSGPGISFASHSEVSIKDNKFPDTTHIETGDHFKGDVSSNLFYASRPAPSPPPSSTRPSFSGTIWQIETSHAVNKPQSLFFAFLEITNSGSQSIANQFHATLKTKDKIWENILPSVLPPNLKLLREDGTRINVEQSQMLYETASVDPILSGGRVAGLLLFVINDISETPKQFELTIYFRDVTGKEYHATELSEAMEPGDTHIPGVNNPFLPRQPSLTPDSGASEH